jgi:hypothetical protein
MTSCSVLSKSNQPASCVYNYPCLCVTAHLDFICHSETLPPFVSSTPLFSFSSSPHFKYTTKIFPVRSQLRHNQSCCKIMRPGGWRPQGYATTMRRPHDAPHRPTVIIVVAYPCGRHPLLLVRVYHLQAAFCLGDRSLHRFDQVIHFFSR